MSVADHKKMAPTSCRVAIVSISTTRALTEDHSGRWMSKTAAAQGHRVIFHEVILDKKKAIRDTVARVIADHSPHVLLLTGGTGIAGSDVTVESIYPRFDKILTAFGALFALLSYQEISSAAIMSRAVAGVMGKTVVFCLPGSLNACKLACTKLIFPELGHLTKHLHDG